MSKRDSEYEICGMVELDEGFFSKEVPDDEKDKPLKRGKGSQKKSKVLPWVHIAIANAKRLLLDVYHDIRPEYLQNYLNEFCWKFNRRNFGEALFDRLMVAAVSYKNQFRYNIE